MSLRHKKLGLLLSCGPEAPAFRHGIRLAETALHHGVSVYLYCIDEAVRGLEEPALQRLKSGGLHLFACAYGAQRRGLPINDTATFGGLSLVSDLVAGTDRFLHFG